MFKFLLSQPTGVKLTAAVVMAAQMLGWITYAQTGATASNPPPAPSPPPPNSLLVARRALREFDRFLDHHPVLEDQLRLDSRQTTSRAFLDKNPELRDFLQTNPNVAEGLKVYPRYFLNRALLRQANAPLSFQELAPFKELFQQEPGLERDLTTNPELVRNPVYLESHVALRAFFAERPTLARLFVPPTDSQTPK